MAQAREIMERAAILLADVGGTRWPATELRLWLNDGLREILLAAPSAATRTIVIDMQIGTRQELPESAAALLRVSCNVVNTIPGGLLSRGMAVTPVSRDVMDRQIPGWQAANTLPYSRNVRHTVDDPLDQRAFLVAPGNNGQGQIECLVSARIEAVDLPAVAPESIGSYVTEIYLDDIYLNALLDYVMYRALSKDVAVPSIAGRAQAHYSQFASAIGMKMQTETTLTPDTKPNAQA